MTTTRILGHNFTPMTDDDFEAFGGAPEGSLIWQGDKPADPILIAAPIGNGTYQIHECDPNTAQTIAVWSPFDSAI